MAGFPAPLPVRLLGRLPARFAGPSGTRCGALRTAPASRPAPRARGGLIGAWIAAALALAPLLAVLPLQAGAQTAQDELRDTFGDWQLRCASDPSSGREACVIAQIGKGAQGNDVVEVRIRKLDGITDQDGRQVPAAIQIIAPLGVALKAGMRVQIDGNNPRGAAFEVCLASGCFVRETMEQAFIDEMKAGAVAKVSLAAITGQGAAQVDVDISLSGFTRAFNTLRP
ncbi:MAG: invasion associated locus B family protein [Pseudomonadota bacterium]